jgi:predicted transcriptional regulator
MTVTELEKKTTLYKVGQLLGLTYPAVYKWRKTNKIPPLRLFQLKEMKPDWFTQEKT